MSRIIVTGGGSGLGAHLVQQLRQHGHDVHIYDKANGCDVRNPPPFPGRLDVIVNCAGVNRIAWLQDLTDELWDETLDVNAKGIMTMARAFLPQLRESRGTIVNIVSNAAHVPMRCSAAYNASKGAALILTKQLARELAPDITVFSVSPNKLADTGMSRSIDEQVMVTRGWTREQAQAYQRQSLLTGEETPPEQVAEFIAFLLSNKQRHRYLTGCDISYGA